MKRRNCTGLIALMAAFCLTGCGMQGAAEPEKLQQEVITTTDPPTELEDFSQMITFFKNDPKYDPETIQAEYYIQKVEVADDSAGAETEIIVVSYVKNLASGNDKHTTNAALWQYHDPVTGGVEPAKREWWNEGTPYTAESIIAAALEELKMTAEDLVLHEKYVLYSTFPEEE